MPVLLCTANLLLYNEMPLAILRMYCRKEIRSVDPKVVILYCRWHLSMKLVAAILPYSEKASFPFECKARNIDRPQFYSKHIVLSSNRRFPQEVTEWETFHIRKHVIRMHVPSLRILPSSVPADISTVQSLSCTVRRRLLCQVQDY